MSELLPCPFCGGEAEPFNPFDNADGTWCVLCSECAAATGFEQTEAEAIATWNIRAERTCKMRADGAHCMNGVEFYECRSCGEYACIPTVMGKSEPPNYCPNCGSKVVGE